MWRGLVAYHIPSGTAFILFGINLVSTADSLHLSVSKRSGGTVLGKRVNLLLDITEGGKHFCGVAAQCRTWAVSRLIVGDGEGASYGNEFTDFSALVNLHEGIAVVK